MITQNIKDKSLNTRIDAETDRKLTFIMKMYNMRKQSELVRFLINSEYEKLKSLNDFTENNGDE